jgi:hypothetical protein
LGVPVRHIFLPTPSFHFPKPRENPVKETEEEEEKEIGNLAEGRGERRGADGQ